MAPSNKIRIMVVDEHRVVRSGLVALLGTEHDMEVVAEAESGQRAIELYRKHQPDVTLMDLRMPGMNGIEATAAIRGEFPNARIIVFSSYGSGDEIHAALLAGAMSYVLKEVEAEELIKSVRLVHAGRRYVSGEVGGRLADRVATSDLTSRELEVLKLLAQGNDNREIAIGLGIAEGTVKNHVKAIFSKLYVRDRTQATLEAIRRGIVRVD